MNNVILTKACLVFGFLFLLAGVLGFVPLATLNGHLFGLFHVNAAHNAVHILSGGIAMFAGLKGAAASRVFFRVFGVVYGLVAILGAIQGDGLLLGLIANNTADVFLHAGIAGFSLILGFCPWRVADTAPSPPPAPSLKTP